jgi:hypothetical protein
MLIFHFLGLVISLGSMITFLVMRRSCSKVSSSDSEYLLMNIRRFLRMSHIGLGIMFVTGGYLMTPYWNVLGQMPLLHIKFSVFLLWFFTLFALSFYTKKAKNSQIKLCDPRIGFLSLMSILFGLIAVTMAVLRFDPM